MPRGLSRPWSAACLAEQQEQAVAAAALQPIPPELQVPYVAQKTV